MSGRYDEHLKQLIAVMQHALREKRKRDKSRYENHPGGGAPRSVRRAEARLLMLPPDRVCPICEGVKLKSNQWIVGKHVSYAAICKSCWRKS